MEYMWYLINIHRGSGHVKGRFAYPMCHILGDDEVQEPSECSWLIPTWEAFERASV